MAKILRPLWLKSDRLVPLNDEIAVPVPSAWLQFPSQCAARLTELGYNALLLGLRGTEAAQVAKCEALSFEVPILIKPYLDATGCLSGCPLNLKWQQRVMGALDTLCRRVPHLHGIFWESGLLDSSYNQHSDATQADLVFEELRIVEKAVSGRAHVIFYVPTDQGGRQAGWLSDLCDAAGKNTSIAFSAVRGSPWHDHLPLHPFWEVLAASPDISSTPLMPIVNLGMVGLGNGLWPCIPFDLFERCLTQCVRHRFDGPIVISEQLPGKGGALECSLWMGAQGNGLSAELLAGKWLRSRRGDLDFETWASLMRKTRETALDIQSIADCKSVEHKRFLLESLSARLKFLVCHYEAQNKSQQLPTLFDYLSGFVCEARNLLVESAHSSSVNLFGQSKQDEREFWNSKAGIRIRQENLFP